MNQFFHKHVLKLPFVLYRVQGSNVSSFLKVSHHWYGIHPNSSIMIIIIVQERVVFVCLFEWVLEITQHYSSTSQRGSCAVSHILLRDLLFYEVRGGNSWKESISLETLYYYYYKKCGVGFNCVVISKLTILRTWEGLGQDRISCHC